MKTGRNYKLKLNNVINDVDVEIIFFNLNNFINNRVFCTSGSVV